MQELFYSKSIASVINSEEEDSQVSQTVTEDSIDNIQQQNSFGQYRVYVDSSAYQMMYNPKISNNFSELNHREKYQKNTQFVEKQEQLEKIPKIFTHNHRKQNQRQMKDKQSCKHSQQQKERFKQLSKYYKPKQINNNLKHIKYQNKVQKNKNTKYYHKQQSDNLEIQSEQNYKNKQLYTYQNQKQINKRPNNLNKISFVQNISSFKIMDLDCIDDLSTEQKTKLTNNVEEYAQNQLSLGQDKEKLTKTKNKNLFDFVEVKKQEQISNTTQQMKSITRNQILKKLLQLPFVDLSLGLQCRNVEQVTIRNINVYLLQKTLNTKENINQNFLQFIKITHKFQHTRAEQYLKAKWSFLRVRDIRLLSDYNMKYISKTGQQKKIAMEVIMKKIICIQEVHLKCLHCHHNVKILLNSSQSSGSCLCSYCCQQLICNVICIQPA